MGNKDSKLKKDNKMFNEILRDKYLYLMLVPFLLYYILFYYLPMNNIQIAFKNYIPFMGVAGSKWVGLENFKAFFTGPYVIRLIRNTLVLSVCDIIFGFPAPIILALAFNELRNKKFRTIMQTITYMPHFISIVVVTGMVITFLSPTTGIVNTIISKLGGEKIYFLSKPEYFRTIYTSMNIWKSVGFSSIIYYSALCSIDAQLYEAANIDGAGRWKQTIHITIPEIMPTIAIMLIMRVGHLLDIGAETIILLYQPVTYETADVIGSFVYRAGMSDSNYSLATAVGLFNGLVALILVMISNRISRKLGDVGIW